MTVKDRMRAMGLLPDIGRMQQQLDEKFELLYGVLIEIRDELRTQGEAPR